MVVVEALRRAIDDVEPVRRAALITLSTIAPVETLSIETAPSIRLRLSLLLLFGAH